MPLTGPRTSIAASRIPGESCPAASALSAGLVHRIAPAGELNALLPQTRAAQVLPPAPAAPAIDDLSLWEREHALLVQALERAGGNQSEAARLMKISREQLRTRMRKYGLLPNH